MHWRRCAPARLGCLQLMAIRPPALKTVRRPEAQQHMLAVHMPAVALDLGRSKQNIRTTLSNPAGLTLTDCCDWLPPDAIFCRMELKSKLSPMVCSNCSSYTLCEFPRVDAIPLLMRTKLCGLKAVAVGNLGRGITADLCNFRYACTKATIAQLQDVLGTHALDARSRQRAEDKVAGGNVGHQIYGSSKCRARQLGVCVATQLVLQSHFLGVTRLNEPSPSFGGPSLRKPHSQRPCRPTLLSADTYLTI